jgi:hypothetical protein
MATPLSAVRLAEHGAEFAAAEPFPHIAIDNFIDGAVAREIAADYPTFETAKTLGFSFDAVNERKKIQITDRTRFPPAVRRLSDFLASPAFLADLSALTGIPNLLADEALFGGGMHMTGPHGRLDVHVDFNRGERDLYRRLNLLLYLNPEWDEAWGGQIELWDTAVKNCRVSLPPILGRCVIFETSGISFHGVAPLKCPPDRVRRSFATYYYTKEPPGHGDTAMHGTIFRARPDEKLRGYVLMPAERIKRGTIDGIRFAAGRARRIAGRVLRLLGVR